MNNENPTEEIDLVAISEFKARCLKMLDQVRCTGTPLMVTRRGEPVAMIVPPPPQKRDKSWLGVWRKTARIEGDIVSPVIAPEEWEVLST